MVNPDSDASGRVNVAIDVSAVHAGSGGVLRYVTELVRHLPGSGVHATLIDQRSRSVDGSRELFGLDEATFVAGRAPGPRLWRLAWEQYALDRVVGNLDIELLHSPHYTMPRWHLPLGPWRTGGNGPGSRKRPAHVVTVHDLTFFSLPHLHARSKRRMFQSSIRFAALHADALICVSDRTADQLRHYVDVKAPVVVAPHGIDPNRFRPSSADTEEPDARVLARYGIVGPYVLWLGAIAPHKNLGTLMQAFNRVAPAGLGLVVGGKSWPGAWESVVPHVPAVAKRIGFVPDDDVPALLRNAAVFAYPSFEEGFGLPVLEALACGTVVLTSRDTVMADVAGSEAVLVDPTLVEAVAEGLRGALELGGSPEQSVGRKARIDRAGTFTWERSARLHSDAYRLALEGAS